MRQPLIVACIIVGILVGPSVLPLSWAQWIVTTIPQLDINLSLLDAVKHHGYQGRKAFVSYTDYDSEMLEKAGADLILSPFVDSARDAAERIASGEIRQTKGVS